jgi:hypothetical protein
MEHLVKSDIPYLVFNFVSRKGIQKDENAADGDDDPGVRLLLLKVLSRQSFEIHAIVSQKGLAVGCCESQLSRVGVPKLSRLPGGRRSKTPGTNQTYYPYIDIFVQVQIDEKLFQ